MALNAEHGVELLQTLQPVAEKETNCLRVSFKAVLLKFLPDGSFQVLCSHNYQPIALPFTSDSLLRNSDALGIQSKPYHNSNLQSLETTNGEE